MIFMDTDCFETARQIRSAEYGTLLDIAYAKCGFKSAYKMTRSQLEIIGWLYLEYNNAEHYEVFSVDTVFLRKATLHSMIHWLLRYTDIDVYNGSIWHKNTHEPVFVDPY